MTMAGDSPNREGSHGSPWRCLAQADPNHIRDMVLPWLSRTRTPWLATAYRRFPEWGSGPGDYHKEEKKGATGRANGMDSDVNPDRP